MSRQQKIQTKETSIPTTTTAQTSSVDFEPDQSYDRIVGIGVVEITDGDQSTYKIGFEDEDGNVYLDLVEKSMLLTGVSVPPKEKYFPLNIPITKGRKYKIKHSFGSTIATDALNFITHVVLAKD